MKTTPPPVTIDCPHCAEWIGLELGTIRIGLELQCPACGITFACSTAQLRQAFLMVNEMFFNR